MSSSSGTLLIDAPSATTGTPLREMPQRARRNLGLDFARGCAILMVMGYHFRAEWTTSRFERLLIAPFHKFGATGVEMFFVLSGFVVGGLLLQEYKTTRQIKVKQFLLRRAMKILPPYYAYVLMQIITRHFPFRTFGWQSLLQIQNYTGTSISHTWTLAVEVHFYVLLVLAMDYMASRRFSPRHLLWSFVGGILLVTLVRSITIHLGYGEAALFFTHNRLDALLCGVLLAAISCFYPARFEWLLAQHWTLLLVAAGLLAYLFLVYPRTMSFPTPGWGYVGFSIMNVGYSAVLLLTMRYAHWMARASVCRAIAWIGTYSYSIYLWHNSVRSACAWLVHYLQPSIRWPVLLLAQFVSAIALGVLMTRLIEWPVLRLRDQVMPQREVAAIAKLAA